uniref:hypothetical protein n=1 Tax=Marinomonas sp. ef1 TaxID=2005043 RepID=UPI001E537FEA
LKESVSESCEDTDYKAMRGRVGLLLAGKLMLPSSFVYREMFGKYMILGEAMQFLMSLFLYYMHIV